MRPSVRIVSGATAVLLVAAALLGATAGAADAKTPRPARPHGELVTSVGTHSVTVRLPKIKNATRYRLYVATSRSELTVRRIEHARHSRSSTTPRLTVRGLPATTTRYYFRVRVAHGSRHRFGTHVGSFVLPPGRPTGLRASSSAAGTWLAWRAPSAYTSTRIARATNARMTAGVVVSALRGTTGRYTPDGLVTGRRYWFRVRTIKGATGSAWSSTVSVVVRSHRQSLRLLSYNVLTSVADGTVTTGERIAPWAQRRAGVLGLIRRANPDVLSLQEAGGWAGQPHGYGGTRQVDDLLTGLPGYALARTETPPTEHHYLRYANYVLYKTAVYQAVGAGGVWQLGDGKTAAYQLLRQRRTGARLLATSVHLNFRSGRVGDDQRAAETRRLLAQGSAAARRARAAVVYAGDFNSVRNRNHVYDAVGQTMARAGIPDARNVARSLGNDAYNSVNLYRRLPARAAQSIDYVFAPPGVAVASRRLLLVLAGGRFRGVIPSDHNPLLVVGAYPY